MTILNLRRLYNAIEYMIVFIEYNKKYAPFY